MTSSRLFFIGVLVLAGAAWGITQPLAKIAVSTGYQHFGLIFWQLALGAVVLGIVVAVQGKGLPFNRRVLPIYMMIAVIGTILPNSASYQAVVHLPSGLMSVLLSTVPMLAFPVSMALGLDRFSWLRAAGLTIGLMGVVLIVAPEASLPDRAMVAWVPVALIAPLCYAFEGNLVARLGLRGLDPVQALAGASVVGTVMAAPLALGTGQFIVPSLPLGAPEYAHLAAAFIHAGVYTTYVWLVGRTGPTFAAQVSYLVTGFGVFWAILLLGESFSNWVWAAMGLMFIGLFLVQPRASRTEPATAAP
ncbi:MAG: DMT family transporter [Pseudomonadota bacterium]